MHSTSMPSHSSEPEIGGITEKSEVVKNQRIAARDELHKDTLSTECMNKSETICVFLCMSPNHMFVPSGSRPRRSVRYRPSSLSASRVELMGYQRPAEAKPGCPGAPFEVQLHRFSRALRLVRLSIRLLLDEPGGMWDPWHTVEPRSVVPPPQPAPEVRTHMSARNGRRSHQPEMLIENEPS